MQLIFQRDSNVINKQYKLGLLLYLTINEMEGDKTTSKVMTKNRKQGIKTWKFIYFLIKFEWKEFF